MDRITGVVPLVTAFLAGHYVCPKGKAPGLLAVSQIPVLQDKARVHNTAGLFHLIETGAIAMTQESTRIAMIFGDLLVPVHNEKCRASPYIQWNGFSLLGLSLDTLKQQAIGAIDADAQPIADRLETRCVSVEQAS